MNRCEECPYNVDTEIEEGVVVKMCQLGYCPYAEMDEKGIDY